MRSSATDDVSYRPNFIVSLAQIPSFKNSKLSVLCYFFLFFVANFCVLARKGCSNYFSVSSLFVKILKFIFLNNQKRAYLKLACCRYLKNFPDVSKTFNYSSKPVVCCFISPKFIIVAVNFQSALPLYVYQSLMPLLAL